MTVKITKLLLKEYRDYLCLLGRGVFRGRLC